MIFSMNIHPKTKWVTVDAKLYGSGSGNCVIFTLTDDEGRTASPFVHYGDTANQNEFIKMLKDAVNGLPLTCACCHQEVKSHE